MFKVLATQDNLISTLNSDEMLDIFGKNINPTLMEVPGLKKIVIKDDAAGTFEISPC